MTHPNEIKSIKEIVAFLREQAKLRSAENDEAGILLRAALSVETSVFRLEHPGYDASVFRLEHPGYDGTE
jgi:hypothetical protein